MMHGLSSLCFVIIMMFIVYMPMAHCMLTDKDATWDSVVASITTRSH